MAVQSLIAQDIVFISASESFDENAILANSLIQSLISNSTGGDITFGYRQFANLNGSVITRSSYFFIEAYVLPSFQATIQTNIPNLQAAFPQYTIATWGYSIQFGN